MLARAMVRSTLSAFYLDGHDPQRVVIKRQERGKPWLAMESAIEFSLAHTDTMIALAVRTDGTRVGVDVERADRRPKRGALALARRHFAAVELEELERIKEDVVRSEKCLQPFIDNPECEPRVGPGGPGRGFCGPGGGCLVLVAVVA